MFENEYFEKLLNQQWLFLEKNSDFVSKIEQFGIEATHFHTEWWFDFFGKNPKEPCIVHEIKKGLIEQNSDCFSIEFDGVNDNDIIITKKEEGKDVIELYLPANKDMALRINAFEDSPIFIKNSFRFYNQLCTKSEFIKNALEKVEKNVFIQKTIVEHDKTTHSFFARKELLPFKVIEENDGYTIIYEDTNNCQIQKHSKNIQEIVQIFELDFIAAHALQKDF